jgi:hypothetical protein
MTDLLTERFAALADSTDDSDWLDVRRRARRAGRRWPTVAAAAVAAAAAAAAVAAGSGWLFTTRDHRVTAVTQVQLGGQTWRVSVTSGGRLRICVRVSHDATTRTACRGRLLAPPFGARHVDVAGGQVWAGAAVGFTRRIAITDANRVVHSAATLPAPSGTKTPFRYWAIALDGTTATSIAAYDAHGRSITRRIH